MPHTISPHTLTWSLGTRITVCRPPLCVVCAIAPLNAFSHFRQLHTWHQTQVLFARVNRCGHVYNTFELLLKLHTCWLNYKLRIDASWICAPFSRLTLGAHVQRGLRYLVRKCVCLSVTMFSATTHNETTKERYQKVQWILNLAFFV